MLNHGETQLDPEKQKALIEERQQTLDWLNEVCGTALAEARKGNIALVNRLSKQSDAMSYYFNNVTTRHALTPEQFARQYPAYLEEAKQVREEYLALTTLKEATPKLNTLEEQLEELKKLVEQQAEQLKALSEAKQEKSADKKKADKKTEKPEENETDEAEE